MDSRKQTIVFYGWTDILHSYAIVNMLHVIHFIKEYSDQYNIYIDSSFPYFFEKWSSIKNWETMWKPHHSFIKTHILPKTRSLYQMVQDKVPIDYIYQIGFPYLINTKWIQYVNKKYIIFYTSESTYLESDIYFKVSSQMLSQDTTQISTTQAEFKPCQFELLKYIMNVNKHKLIMTTPSEWSKFGMRQYDMMDNTVVIPHCVDSSLINKNDMLRQEFRKFYKIATDDIVFLNISAMCGNKNILGIIRAFYKLLQSSHGNIKLFLKGNQDLYQSHEYLETYLRQLGLLDNIDFNLLYKHLIFSKTTLDFHTLNGIYNMSDIYISPYTNEGFNMPCLEAASIGKIVVATKGNTHEFLQKFHQSHIIEINPTNEVPDWKKGTCPCVYNVDDSDIYNACIRAIDNHNILKDTQFTLECIDYTPKAIVQQLKDKLFT